MTNNTRLLGLAGIKIESVIWGWSWGRPSISGLMYHTAITTQH